MLTVRNYIEAAKRRKKEETGEEGFTLIELIIVIVIIGILAAIAIPIFANIQKNANDSAGQSAAANGAATAAVIAANDTGTTALLTQGTAYDGTGTTDFDKLVKGSVTGLTITKYTQGSVASICVTATVKDGSFTYWQNGPGCTGADGHN